MKEAHHRVAYSVGLIIFFLHATCGLAYAASSPSSTVFDLLLSLLLGAAGGGAAATAPAFYVKQRRAGQLDLETAEQAGVAGRFRTVQPQDADVSVFAPPVAAPDRDILIQVMIHTPERESEALSRAQKTEPTAEELASIPLTVQLNANDIIRATLECEGAKIAEPVQSIRWNGRLVCLYFTMRVLSSANSVLAPKIRLFVNAIPAGIVIFKVKVIPGAADAPLDYAQQEGRRFQWAFISYAHEDRIEVLKATQLLNALRMRYFQDVLSQKPGEQWRHRLLSEIQQCDVFLLFWSRHARDSEWVLTEAKYALDCSKLAQGLEIVPVLLEGPPPAAPIPKELGEINFNDPIRYAIFAEEIAAKHIIDEAVPASLANPETLSLQPIQPAAIHAQCAVGAPGPDGSDPAMQQATEQASVQQASVSVLMSEILSRFYPTIIIFGVLAAMIAFLHIARSL